jgi:hypothetical protein
MSYKKWNEYNLEKSVYRIRENGTKGLLLQEVFRQAA